MFVKDWFNINENICPVKLIVLNLSLKFRLGLDLNVSEYINRCQTMCPYVPGILTVIPIIL